MFSAILGGSTSILYQVQYTDFNCRSAYILASTFSICLWYYKMWYLSLRIIDFMVHQKAIHGLDVFAPKEFDYLCNRCANSKSYYLPLSRSSASQYFKMELLIMNLTRHRYLYILVIVEVSCHYAVSHLLKEKEETGIAILDIIAMIEHQSGLKAY